VKAPTQLIETMESNIQPTKKIFTRPCAQTYHKANVVFAILEPLSFMHDALFKEDAFEWQKVVQDELASLTKNNMWKLTTPPTNRHAVSSKWVFKIKTKANGSIDHYKACSMSRGFTQILEVDFP
jgi:hypothetical protein